MTQSNNSPLRSAALNLSILFGVWLLGFAIVQLSGKFSILWIGEAGQFVVALLGLIVASKLRTRLAAVLLLTFAIFSFAELTIHVAFGMRALRGGPSNLAVAIAAIAGVFVGSLFLRRRPDAWPPAHA